MAPRRAGPPRRAGGRAAPGPVSLLKNLDRQLRPFTIAKSRDAPSSPHFRNGNEVKIAGRVAGRYWKYMGAARQRTMDARRHLARQNNVSDCPGLEWSEMKFILCYMVFPAFSIVSQMFSAVLLPIIALLNVLKVVEGN